MVLDDIILFPMLIYLGIEPFCAGDSCRQLLTEQRLLDRQMTGPLTRNGLVKNTIQAVITLLLRNHSSRLTDKDTGRKLLIPRHCSTQPFQRIFSLYASNTIFVLGVIGNIVSILVFTRLKLFRGNRCAFYLTVESIANIYLICLVEVLILVSDIAQINLANTSIIWCKLQTTLGQPARLFIGSIICFEAPWINIFLHITGSIWFVVR
ncbi:unnamed protein product [Adineta ricciae]|uniref:G-protein coupled receptors family 1 profile domain-containing protein n=1 Tax=Adineta ricciae TaxID=249248 RepID=A0A815PPJ2_ADIRI|nr:unnamed protein product [Adineta ricciae]